MSGPLIMYPEVRAAAADGRQGRIMGGPSVC